MSLTTDGHRVNPSMHIVGEGQIQSCQQFVEAQQHGRPQINNSRGAECSFIPEVHTPSPPYALNKTVDVIDSFTSPENRHGNARCVPAGQVQKTRNRRALDQEK